MNGQDAFADALLRPDTAAPAGVVNPDGTRAGKRFDVYRNNVAVSLTEALQTAFPAIRKLVGDAFFKALAGVYLRQHPPSSPLIMFYGAEMPAFLADFAPARSLPYLPDIARVELAVRHAYHAADAQAVDPSDLSKVPEDAMPNLVFGFAPALSLVESTYPVHGIWAAQMTGAPSPTAKPEAALISRPDLDPFVDPLSPDGAKVLRSLRAGATLGQALAHVGPQFDLSPLLTLLLTRRAIISLTIEETAP